MCMEFSNTLRSHQLVYLDEHLTTYLYLFYFHGCMFPHGHIDALLIDLCQVARFMDSYLSTHTSFVTR